MGHTFHTHSEVVTATSVVTTKIVGVTANKNTRRNVCRIFRGTGGGVEVEDAKQERVPCRNVHVIRSWVENTFFKLLK